MNGFQDALDDVDAMAMYWQRHKMEFLIEASEEFVSYVRPRCYYEEELTQAQLDMVNVCFTEWALFERALPCGRTPLERFVAERPVALPKRSWKRLEQICQSQFFSRFAILDKDRRAGVAQLSDVCGGRCFEVYDERLCAIKRWRDGTIGERIACVDGEWLAVGQARLYDKAEPEHTASDGPGAIHPEERAALPKAMLDSFYLRLCHDVLGVDGRYSPSARIREVA